MNTTERSITRLASYGVKIERSKALKLPRHPEAPSSDSFVEWCNEERRAGRRLAVDLFSGAGGLGVGVEAAGWTIVAAVDNDVSALETHAANFPGRALNTDMSDQSQVKELIKGLLPLGIDMVVGGPPCQPFSSAGRAKIQSLVDQGLRDPKDSRKDLWRSFIQVVVALRPRAVIMENVPDMALADDLGIIREIADQLERAGYTVDYRLLDAWRYGVPQHRKRFILQARNDGAQPTWPAPHPSKTTVRDAIGDLPTLDGTTGARELPYEGKAVSDLAQSLRPIPSPVIFDHMTRPVRDDDREAFELMTPKTLYSDLPARLRRYSTDSFRDKYKRLGWDDLSRTVTAHIAKDGYSYIHPEEHRTLTVREAARLQTFPDLFRFAGTRSDAFRQIGNAVPPLLGQVVARELTPKNNNEDSSPHLPLLRNRLMLWATNERESRWWLFPGEKMTPAAAVIAAALEVHRLSPKTAGHIMNELAGVCSLTFCTLSHIQLDLLSETRRERIREIRRILRETPYEDSTQRITGLLSATQLTVFQLLLDHRKLLLNDRVAQIVSLLRHLPREYRGLRTDIKVGLAQLVGSDSHTALRMCAIRAITLPEAKAHIYPSAFHKTSQVKTHD